VRTREHLLHHKSVNINHAVLQEVQRQHAKLVILGPIAVLELSGVRDRFLVGCEDCASHIIPDPALIKNKVQRAGGASAKRPANRLGNPLLVRKN
jgi:hypothetical protein